MAGFQLPFGVKPVNAVPVDFYSGPYTSNISIQDALDEAYVAIPLAIRFKTMEVRLIVNGIGAKYWFRDGVTNNDLVEFTTSSSFYVQGGTTYSSDTTSNIYRTGAVNIGSNSASSSTAKLYVSSNQSGAFRLEDGTQGPGYLLTSDVNGVAGWTISNYLRTASASFYVQGGTISSFDTTSDIYRTGSLNIGTGSVVNGRFVVSSTTGTVSLVVDESGGVYNNSRGSDNTLFGNRALYSNVGGDFNTVFGRLSVYNNTSGNYNTGVGYQSLYYNTTGEYNTAFGANSLVFNRLGDFNTAIGYNSLYFNTTAVNTLGTFSVGNGYTTGTYSDIALIYATGSTAISYPKATIIVGTGGTISSVTLSTTDKGTGFKDTTTILTAATSSIGNGTGFTIRVSTILSGQQNTAIGHQALFTNKTGSENVAIGFNSLFSNTTAGQNVGVGRNTLYSNETGIRNTAIGFYSSFYIKGSNNTTLGYQSLYSTTASTATSNNTAIGFQSLFSIIDGSDNTALGYHAGHYIESGVVGLTLSNWSTYIGSYTRGYAYNTTHEVVIGASAIGNGSYSVTLGNDLITKTILKGNIGIGTASPSTKLHIYATQSGAFRLVDGTQGLGKILVSDATGVGSWTASVTGPQGATGATGIGYVLSTSASHTLLITTQSFTTSTLSTSSAFIVGNRVRVITNADPNGNIWMEGNITLFTGFSLNINIDTINGILGNTYTGWKFTIVGNKGAVGATGFGVTSSFYLQGTSNYAYDTTSPIYRTGPLSIGAGTASNSRFVVSSSGGTNSLVVGENGGVSIGGALTSYALKVYGNAQVTSFFYTNVTEVSTAIIFDGAGHSGIKKNTGLDFFTFGTSSTIRFTNNNYGISSGETTMLIDTTKKYVGIGTASPSTKLHIYATQSGAFRLEDTTQGPGKVLISDANGVATWTSSIQTQLDTKLTAATGTINYLQKVNGVNSLGNSSIFDDGSGYIGINTINTPGKSITFGYQANREIGIEESPNNIIGKDLLVSAGRTINYVYDNNFNGLLQISRAWNDIAVAPNGNVYVVVNNGDIYMQTAGSGNFVSLGQTSRAWTGIAVAPNGNVYAVVNNGDIYMQTAGSGNFVSLGQTLRAWNGITVAPNGNVYAVVNNGDIYMQTAGSGNFVSLGQTSRAWTGIAVAPNGNVYAVVNNGDIYMQTAGSGNFVSLGQTSRAWRGIAAAPNGNIYACGGTSNGDIYMQTAGSGNFVSLGQTLRSWEGIAVAPNGNVYACVSEAYTSVNGDIYMQTAGSGNFIALGQTLRNWYGIGSDPNGNIYASELNGDIYLQRNFIVGTPDLQGGTLKLQAGTGKGTGDSNLDFYTGQKTITGTDMQISTLRLRIDNEGNVGIGTATPSTTLHIFATQSGAFRLQDGTQASGYVLTSDATGVGTWTASVSGPTIEPSQITITTTASITTGTTASNGYGQSGKNVIIDNGSNAINITVNGGTDFVASYVKHGTASITFVQGSGRTLIQVDATAVLNGVVGSTATISSILTTDYLRISNA